MDIRSEIKTIRIEISRFVSSFFIHSTTSQSFLETAMTFLHSYKQKGFLLRRTVFLNSMLLYNSMGNFTDHEFDKEGLIRKVKIGMMN